MLTHLLGELVSNGSQIFTDYWQFFTGAISTASSYYLLDYRKRYKRKENFQEDDTLDNIAEQATSIAEGSETPWEMQRINGTYRATFQDFDYDRSDKYKMAPKLRGKIDEYSRMIDELNELEEQKLGYKTTTNTRYEWPATRLAIDVLLTASTYEEMANGVENIAAENKNHDRYDPVCKFVDHWSSYEGIWKAITGELENTESNFTVAMMCVHQQRTIYSELQDVAEEIEEQAEGDMQYYSPYRYMTEQTVPGRLIHSSKMTLTNLLSGRF